MDWRIGLVVALAVLAGCSTFGTTGDTPTVTPAPVPQQTETTTATPLPPGVTGADVTSTEQLALAHVRAINGTSYTWYSNYTRVRFFDNETYPGYVRKEASVENESHYTYWTNRKEAPRDSQFSYLGEFELYANQTGRYTRSELGGTFSYERLDPLPARLQVGQHPSGAITEYLQTSNMTVAETRVDGRQFYELTGSGYAFPSGQEIRNYTTRALVSPDGFVRSLTVSYEQTRNGERELITYTFHYSQVGNTTVEPPDWIAGPESDSASNGTTTAGD